MVAILFYMAVLFNVSPVYHANYSSKADIVINQGGTDSTKTYSILQVLFTIAATTKAPIEDPIITVVGSSVPNLKKGAYRTAENILGNNAVLQQYIKEGFNQSDRVLKFKTGWIMEFRPAIDEQDAKQGKRQYLFVNEANGVPWLVFWQFAKRTRVRVFVDYNPTAPFWAHDKLIGTTSDTNDLTASIQLIISDHRHNPFLSQKDHDRTENIKDPELWKVYARGLTGNLSGLIYTSWKQIPDADYPWDAPGKFGGIDFGYSVDPTAAVRMVKIANKIFIHELCYETAINEEQLKSIFKANGFKEETPIYCEHDPDMTRALRKKNLMAIPARKGPGSVNSGILKIQKDYEIFYTASSRNIDEERKRYMWLKDETTGKFLNEPVDEFNHLMDAIRYGIYTKYWRAA